ncbi:hypothetical protein NTD78_RS16365 [Enterobacter bugandensis]
MSNIDKRAKSVIRELIADARSRRLGKLIITADEMEMLLDELEAEQRISATWRKTAESNNEKLEAAERRIAEQRETLLAARSYVMQCARWGDAHANGVLQAIDRAAGQGE